MMDVYIPEEYIVKRRNEKKAAASASSAITNTNINGAIGLGRRRRGTHHTTCITYNKDTMPRHQPITSSDHCNNGAADAIFYCFSSVN